MDINNRNVQTGMPIKIISTLRRRISALTRGDAFFKIGITSNPNSRASQYGDEYDEMVVLYRTTSNRFVRKLETVLIEEYWEHCNNEIGGGGGQIGSAPYYLYIVRDID